MPNQGTDRSLAGGEEYSIVIPAYNAEDTLPRAIASVLSQTFPHWTLIIVDDGSTDATAALADAAAADDPRIRIVHQPNRGVAVARNRGVVESRTELVGFLDADDELLPEYLSSMDEFIRDSPGFDIYHPNLTIDDGTKRTRVFCDARDQASFGFEDLLKECVIAVGGALVRRDLFSRIGGFHGAIHCEDYDFWLRATAQGALARYNPEPLYVYHQAQRGRRSEDAIAGAEGLIQSLCLMLENNQVPPSLIPLVERLIDEKREALVRLAQEVQMAEQADRLKNWLIRRFGERAGTSLLTLAHGVTWLVRPIRRLVATRRASRTMEQRARCAKEVADADAEIPTS